MFYVGDLTGSRTGFAFANDVGAIGSQAQLVLMSLDKCNGVFRIAIECVFAGSRRKIAVHVRIICEETIR